VSLILYIVVEVDALNENMETPSCTGHVAPVIEKPKDDYHLCKMHVTIVVMHHDAQQTPPIIINQKYVDSVNVPFLPSSIDPCPQMLAPSQPG
jgi:hypothetical protein